MAHTVRDKRKLLNRIRRIRGQVEAIERALEDESDCARILQTVTSCRGALNGLMVQIVEGHVRDHVLDPRKAASSTQAQAVDELMDVVRAYLR